MQIQQKVYLYIALVSIRQSYEKIKKDLPPRLELINGKNALTRMLHIHANAFVTLIIVSI